MPYEETNKFVNDSYFMLIYLISKTHTYTTNESAIAEYIFTHQEKRVYLELFFHGKFKGDN